MIVAQSAGLTWDRWMYLFMELFSSQNVIVLPEKDWRTFVNNVVSIPELSGYNIPESQGFSTWQQWADYVSGVIL